MSRFAALIFPIILPLLGCATSPPDPNPTVVEREIVKSVLSELCATVLNIRGLAAHQNTAAMNEHFGPNDGWIAAIETNLRTDLEGSVNPSLALLGPIVPGLLVAKGATAGSFNATAGGTIDQTATTLRDNKRYLVIDALLADPVLCPPKNTPAYMAYYDEGAEYRNEGKYLAGKLGLREWLWHGVAAQDFESLIRPTTLVVQGPEQVDSLTVTQRQPGGFVYKQFNTTAKTTGRNFNITILPNVESETKPAPQPKPCIVAQTGDQTSYPGGQIDFTLPENTFTDPNNGGQLKYSVGTGKPYWLSFDPKTRRFTGTVPTANQNTFSVTVTATNNTNNLGCTETVNIIINPIPKTTSWGPTYSATFTFIIKATGQAGPAYTIDRAKAGAATLFSLSRTETNYVNIALTSTGVPLLEVNPTNKGMRTTLLGAVNSSNVDAVDKAVGRLDTALLQLNLSHVFSLPQ